MNREDARNQGSQTHWMGVKLIVWAYKWTLARVALLALLTAVGTICAGWTAAYAQSDGTTVYGNISADTSWTLDNSPYQVTALLNVLPGATLTIQPGVEVQFANATSMAVYGRLVAEGSVEQPILFTGATKTRGSWNGIHVQNQPDSPASLTFRHVIVEYGGDSSQIDAGNVVAGAWATLTIRDSIFRQGGGNGVNVSLDSALQISDTTFLDNQNAALRVYGTIKHDLVLNNLQAEGNGTNAVLFSSVFLETGDYTLAVPGVGLPYRLQSVFQVSKDGRLAVQPGVELQIESRFYVYGELTALGTAEQPIHFTRMDAASANWWGLNITGGPEAPAKANLDHVLIEYGGTTDRLDTGNLIVSSAVVTLTNSVLRAGGNSGIVNQGGQSNQPHSLYVADTQIIDNQGSAVHCTSVSCRQTLAGLTVSGNGFDGIAQATPLNEDTVWSNIGLPYLIEQAGGVLSGTLTIEPGVEIRFAKDANFTVNGGSLIAIGTPTQPITFTGTQAQPGWWGGIITSNRGNSMMMLRYCDIGYAGAGIGSLGPSLLTLAIPALVSDCRLHHSAGSAVHVNGVLAPTLRRNRFEENGAGILVTGALPSATAVDARYNWWSAASGPTHPSNPKGSGETVTDGVLFDPWLSGPTEVQSSALAVSIAGVGRYAPGRTVQYGIYYENFTGQPLKDAVLRVVLPANSDYIGSSSGGIFWPDRRQVFWKLGKVAPGTAGTLVVTIRYDWGLPLGLHTTIAAQLSGSNITPQPFNLADYLNYQPRFVTGEVALGKEQVDAERASNSDLDALYKLASDAGYVYGSALVQSYNTGDVVKQAILLRFQPQMSTFILWWRDGHATGVEVDGSSFTVYKPGGAVRFDLQNDDWEDQHVAAAGAVDPGGIGWKECMTSCIEEKLPSYLVKKYIKSISTISKAVNCAAAIKSGNAEDIIKCSKILGKALPGYGEAVDISLCNTDCEDCVKAGQGSDDERCHYCTEDKYRCSDDDWLWGTFGIDVIMRKRCSPVTHRYLAEEVIETCAQCDKCISGIGQPHCMPKNAPQLAVASEMQPATADLALDTGSEDGPADQQCEECNIAHDPNEMHGPEGDLIPGQMLTYVIDYENVGEGEAYGVFVVDELSEAFDLASLQLPGGAILAGRTIYFPAGDLSAKGQPGAKGSISYQVRLKSDLPSGTVITNRAVVHFPSVPEETPTNTVINMIQPIALTPQQLETAFEQPVAIQLQGQEAANQPLTFVVAEEPLYGILSGTPPNLTYQPAPGYVGPDRFTFTAGNGVTTSRPAEVTIEVHAATDDHKAPTVLWTGPNDKAMVGPSVALAPGSQNALYTPRLQIQFSEEMDARTVTTATIQVKEPSGRVLPTRVSYDPSVNQAVVLLQEPAKVNTAYTVVVMHTAADLAGNRLAADYQWGFQTEDAGDSPAPDIHLYLPTIER